jgi:acyl-CoA synthetase (AMP-forming)/AMP-acid ligase II
MAGRRNVIPDSAADALEGALRDDPGHPALVARDTRLTYEELDAAVDHAAGVLHRHGAGRGDVIAFSLPNTSAIVVSFYATQRLGAIWLGVNQNLAPPEKRFMLDDTRAALFVSDDKDGIANHPGQRCLVLEATSGWRAWSGGTYPRARPSPEDAAAIAYTSGTTGRPKGVVHSHHNLLLPGAVLVASRGYGPSLRKADCAAMTILNLQVTSTLLVAQAGGTQVVMDRVDPSGVATWIREEAITSWFGVPTILQGLAGSPDVDAEDLASLTDVWTGGTYLPTSVRTAFEQRFARPISATYGSTEVPTIVTIESHEMPRVAESSGTSLPHLTIEIRDDTGGVLPVGALGEITVRSSQSGPWANAYQPMLGYLGHPSATAAAVRDGVLYTGDIGQLDAAGNLFVRDRRHALILRGGANVYPAEVERVLLQLDGVTGASVVGIDDDRLGQRVAAAVELDPGVDLDAAALVAHCTGHIARYKIPEQWLICALPRNAMGKVVRTEVEHWFATGGRR